MIEFYLSIKTVHVIAVLCCATAACFFIRGLMVLSIHTLPNQFIAAKHQHAIGAGLREYVKGSKTGQDSAITKRFFATEALLVFLRAHRPHGPARQ